MSVCPVQLCHGASCPQLNVSYDARRVRRASYACRWTMSCTPPSDVEERKFSALASWYVCDKLHHCCSEYSSSVEGSCCQDVDAGGLQLQPSGLNDRPEQLDQRRGHWQLAKGYDDGAKAVSERQRGHVAVPLTARLPPCCAHLPPLPPPPCPRSSPVFYPLSCVMLRFGTPTALRSSSF